MRSEGKSRAATGGGAALVPKLRFLEFQDAGGWKPKRLGTLFSQREETGRTNLRLLSLMDKDGIIPQEESSRKNTSKGDLSRYLCVMPGDIVYNTMRMWEGRSALSQLQGIVSPAYTVCRPTKDANSVFFSYYFKMSQLIAQFSQYSQGLVKDTLNLKFEAFSRILTATPPTLPEQQKIADCLVSADALITAQGQKVKALRAHKKGLMQQLFPQEGETQPRLRFPEFEGAGNWEDRAIGDFGQVVTGNTPSTAEPTFYGNGIPFVSPADISDLRYVEETKTTLTEAGFKKTRPIRAGSVLFVCIGSTIGKIAQNVRDCATNQQINAVIPNAKHSDGFVYFALSNTSDRIALLAGRQAVPIINKSLFSSVRLLVPSLPEQQRIADCLTSLDDLIAGETRKQGAFKTHKMGLMQQLFPQVGEDGA